MALIEEHEMKKVIEFCEFLIHEVQDLESVMNPEEHFHQRHRLGELCAHVKANLVKSRQSMESLGASEAKERKKEKTEVDSLIENLENVKRLFEKHEEILTELFEIDEIERKAFIKIKEDIELWVEQIRRFHRTTGHYEALKEIKERLNKDILEDLKVYEGEAKRKYARVREVVKILAAENNSVKLFQQAIQADIRSATDRFSGELEADLVRHHQTWDAYGHTCKELDTQTRRLIGEEKLFDNIATEIVRHIEGWISLTEQEIGDRSDPNLEQNAKKIIEELKGFFENRRNRTKMDRYVTLQRLGEEYAKVIDHIRIIIHSCDNQIKYFKALKKKVIK